MQGEKVSLSDLSGVQQTLLITAHGKAMESRMPGSLLKDRFADEALGRLDYDAARLDLGRDGAVSLAMRAKIFDDWTRAFIERHEDAIVLNLGCGLDSRVFRVDPPEGVTWFDVDLPDVVALRQRIYPDRSGGYRLVATSVTDLGWLEEAEARRPAMVVAEGLMPYLTNEDAPKLVERLVDHFTAGELAFDGYNRLGLTLLRATPQLRATGAEVHYAIDDATSLEVVAPGLKLVEEKVQYDSSEVRRMSWPARLTFLLWRYVPALRKIGRLLRYRWGSA
jgi:O-methyltransferase involved in polyketide biosynthesis